MLAPASFPPSIQQHGKVGVYFEAAAVIIVLVLLGQVLELRARSRTGNAIRAYSISHRQRRDVVRDGERTEVPLDEVQRRRPAACGPGEKVPVDGVVLEGQDQRRRVDAHRRADAGRERTGDKVSGGTVNGTGSFLMGPSASAATPCSRRSSRWSRRRSAAARRSRAWPTRSPACLSRRHGDRSADFRRVDVGSGLSRASRTQSSTRSRC